jgi:exonuclease III
MPQSPNAFKDLLKSEQADVICLQETKLQEKHVAEVAPLVGLPSSAPRLFATGNAAASKGWSLYW